MCDQLAVGRMIERLDAGNARQQLCRMPLDVLEQLVLGIRRPADQYGAGSADLGHHGVEEILVLSDVAAADRVGLVVNVTRWVIGVHHGALDVIGIEMKYARLVVIDPDDGMVMLVQSTSPFDVMQGGCRGRCR